MLKNEKETERNRDSFIKETAVLSSLARIIAFSYLPVDITLIMAVIEDKTANNPNSAGENSLVSRGENAIGISCEIPVPIVNTNEFLIKEFSPVFSRLSGYNLFKIIILSYKILTCDY